MFRNGLLVSTAMTAVALLLSGAPAGAFAQSDMHVTDRDANARFLCTYGQFDVSLSYISSSGYSRTITERVAVPVVGRGQTVSQIIVMEGQSSRTRGYIFSAGIYSSNKKGFPGKLIAGGAGQIHSYCGQVTIPIKRTTLQPNTKYWVGEKAVPLDPSSSYVSLYWYANPRAKQHAYVQTHRQSCYSSSCHASSTSNWIRKSKGPWFKLR